MYENAIVIVGSENTATSGVGTTTHIKYHEYGYEYLNSIFKHPK